MKTYHSVVVLYKGYDETLDRRIRKALVRTGVTPDGGGYFYHSNDRDLVFYSRRELPADKVSNIRRILNNIRRWKYVTKATIMKETF